MGPCGCVLSAEVCVMITARRAEFVWLLAASKQTS